MALQDLWQQHQQQFNSFHFSVLMQQLTKLHDQVNTAIAQAAPQQQQQRHTGQHKQQRSALADLEQELGHLLHGDSSKQGAAAAATGNSGSSSSATSSRPLHSRGLAELCPALDGYEHIVGGDTAARSLTAQAQQQPRSRRTQQPPPQLQTRLGGPTAAISGQQLQRPLRPPHTHSTPRQQRNAAPLQPPPAQEQQQQQLLLQIHNLARAAAAAAVTPSRRAGLDDRSLVMVAHNLAKMQLHDADTLTRLLQVLGPGVLRRLDAQQLTNLIWSVGTCANSAQGDRSPYQLLVPPGHTASTERARSQQQQQQQQGEKQRDKHRALLASEKAAPAAGLLARDALGVRISHSSSSSSGGGGGGGYRVPASWLSAAADSLLVLLPQCSSQGVSMALWGFAQAGYSPPEPWWQALWAATEGSLQDYSPQNLALTMCAVGKLGPQVGRGIGGPSQGGQRPPSSTYCVYCMYVIVCIRVCERTRKERGVVGPAEQLTPGEGGRREGKPLQLSLWAVVGVTECGWV